MTLADRRFRRLGLRVSQAVALSALLLGCGRDLGAGEEEVYSPQAGPQREYGMRPSAGKLFGGDLNLNNLLGGGEGERGEGLPVNRYLWQATLDTLDFLPLVSTDPFTGVIATDWAGTPQAPGERLKVTAYLTSPELEASSLRVAVYRQVADGQGGWRPAAASPEVALRLENAILTRARQLRIAELDAAG